jgi:Flp pilus assembly protein TadG
VLVFALISMVVLLAMVGFAVDVGHAYLVQRQLQSGVDAAALAGAQELPDGIAVTNAANAYGPSLTKKNAITSEDNATTTVTLKCVTTVVGCSTQFNTHNAVQVDATSNVKTYFARVIGVNSFNVHATATACSPCSAKPLDVMVVLDRTGSMCQPGNPATNDCPDMKNATDGVKTFLGFMDPALDEVGLAVFPPTLDGSCAMPTQGNKNYGYNGYWPSWTLPLNDPLRPASVYVVASPVFDYLNKDSSGNWQLNPASSVIQSLNSCTRPSGSTYYATALEEAEHEIEVHGRGNVQNVIIFLSDGAANVNPAPRWVPPDIDNAIDRTRPCGSGIKAAATVKASGTIIYTIGYDVSGGNGGTCASEGLTAEQTLTQMATTDSGGPNYYNQPVPAQLNTIFTRIAADISRPSSRLIG